MLCPEAPRIFLILASIRSLEVCPRLPYFSSVPAGLKVDLPIDARLFSAIFPFTRAFLVFEDQCVKLSVALSKTYFYPVVGAQIPCFLAFGRYPGDLGFRCAFVTIVIMRTELRGKACPAQSLDIKGSGERGTVVWEW